MTKGKIVEHRPGREIFTNPQHDYTRHLLASEPKGDRRRRGRRQPVVMEARRHEGLVSDQGGLLRKVVDM
jgi:microcin C transport system ATP-binding protein